MITSDEDANVRELGSRLRRREWGVATITSDVEEGMRYINKGHASVLYIEDSSELPASFAMRSALKYPIVMMTPTIVSVADSQADKVQLNEIGFPEIIDKPAGPNRFIEALDFALRKWSTGDLAKVLSARDRFLQGVNTAGMKMLTDLMRNTDLMPILVPAISQSIQLHSDPKVIEKILLSGIREHPRNIGIILSTIDFYINMAMPETALKVAEAAKRNHGPSALLAVEKAQSYLLLNDIESSIAMLEDLLHRAYMPDLVKSFIGRCCYTSGAIEGFMDSIDHKVALLQDYKTAWDKKEGA